jgi:hypothetical protein
MKHLSSAPFWGRLLALPTNIRLGWKSLPGANTLAFHENSQLSRKKFYNIGYRVKFKILRDVLVEAWQVDEIECSDICTFKNESVRKQVRITI